MCTHLQNLTHGIVRGYGSGTMVVLIKGDTGLDDGGGEKKESKVFSSWECGGGGWMIVCKQIFKKKAIRGVSDNKVDDGGEGSWVAVTRKREEMLLNNCCLVRRMMFVVRISASSVISKAFSIIPVPAGIVQLSSNTHVEPSSSTSNPVRIIPGPAGLVQRAKLLKENVFILDPDGALMSTQEYMQKVVEDVGEDADFNSGAWVSATNYIIEFGGTVTGCLGDIDNFLKKGKLEQVVAIVKSCYPNAFGDLNVTLKDLSGTVPGTIHHKVLDVGSYGKDITVGADMILANVLIFTPKPSEHYLNITKTNVVEVFRKDTISLAFNLFIM
ncbi:zinc finger, CCHC-type containing protein [Tanacetum coccineum]